MNLSTDGRVLQTDLVCAGRTLPIAALAGSRDRGASPSSESPATHTEVSVGLRLRHHALAPDGDELVVTEM